MTAALIAIVLGLASAQAEPQERPKVPDDSIELTVVGCIEGRVIKTIPRREADVQRGPDVGERSFRLAGKRDVMDEVKKRNKQLVEVVGIVKRSALDDKGVQVGRRVTIGGGSPVAGTSAIPSPAGNVDVMDVSSVTLRATSCRGE